MAPQESAAGRRGTILVMDDEESIALLVQSVLTTAGYEVCGAHSGVEALERFHERTAQSRPFDLVILDLRPGEGLSGAEVLKEMRTVRPGLKALAASGSYPSAQAAPEDTASFSAFLPKPFRVHELRDAVENLMSDGGTPSASPPAAQEPLIP